MQQKPAPTVSVESPVMGISAEQAFSLLNEKEKNYAYYFLQAAWQGSKICWFQKSFESPALFILLQLVFSGKIQKNHNSQGQSLKELELESKVSDFEFQQFLAYSAAVLNNCGNYYSYGDSKFIPEVPLNIFVQIVQASQAYRNQSFRKIIDEILEYSKEGIYSYDGRYEKLGFHPADGQNGYYSQSISRGEIDLVDELLATLNISGLNTRIFKEKNSFKVMIASSNLKPVTVHSYRGQRVEIHHGHLSPFLRSISENLSQALPYAANKNQENMLKTYIEHFNSGDMEQHKESQRWWIKDQGPVVETNIGFIETYQDPKQQRAEFEGFVSLVDKKLSERTNNLVNQAEKFTALLPWPKEFEKDRFLRPDFTSLEVLGFASSGTPVGINIPNYDDIRMEEGFKNVHLGNCIPKVRKVYYLQKEDGELLTQYFHQALFHIIIYHELLGHGSGKLFQVKNDGSLNYEPTIINPLTGQPVGSDCYKANDTWHGKFQSMSNPYEECRADAVALYYACFKEAYEVIQPEEIDNWEKIRNTVFIDFIYSAVQGLQFFNAEHNKWGQAHTNGEWVIFQTLLQSSDEMIVINEIKTEEGKDWFEIKLKTELFGTIGFKAISDLLIKLQVYKSLADVEGGTNFFKNLSQVDEKFLRIRDIVINNKKPRRLELQMNITRRDDGTFEYVKYPETFAGIIESYLERYPIFDTEFYLEWKKQSQLMKPQ